MTPDQERRAARRTTRIFIAITIIVGALSVVLPLVVHPAAH